jgi:hypothetical protein
MALTQARGGQILDESIQRADLNATTAGSAVIKKLILGGSLSAQGMTLTQTGVDGGTGDVTLAGTLTAAVVGFNGTSWTAPNISDSNCVIARWIPGAGGVVPGVQGFSALSATGTLTARVVAVTNALAREIRNGYVSAATAAAFSQLRQASTFVTLGNDTLGGFFFQIMFGCSDAAAVAGARQFVGIQATPLAATNVEPSTLLNCIGVGHGAADTNLKLFTGGSAANAPVDLGANFPINTLATDAYVLTLYAPRLPTSAGYKVGWHLNRIGTAFTANGTLTGAVGTTLPALTAMLGLQAWRTNNATALAVGLDIGAIIIATRLP